MSDPVDIDSDFDIDKEIDDDDDISLQTDWLHELEVHNNDYNSFYKDDIFSIKISKVYINDDKNIQHVSCENIELDEKNVITYKQLAHIINNSNHIGKNKYRLFRSYLYNIDTDPEDLNKFIKSNTFSPLIREVNVNENIHIRPTIAQFQKLNVLYIIFREVDTSLKGISKKKATRKMKRVSFSSSNSKTRKQL